MNFQLINLDNSRILHRLHATKQIKEEKTIHNSVGYLDQHHTFQRILTEIEYFMDEQKIDCLKFEFENGTNYIIKRDEKRQ